MRITTMRLPVAHKINLGNYESLEIAVDLTAELDEGETPETCLAEYQAEVRRLWLEQAKVELELARERRIAEHKVPAEIDNILKGLK